MIYLFISFIAALAVSISVYAETGSLLMAFAAYSLAGFSVLVTVLVATMLGLRGDDELAAREG